MMRPLLVDYHDDPNTFNIGDQYMFGPGLMVCPVTEPGSVSPSTEWPRDDNCDLCEAARITEWFHEDDVCWIAECEICATPMVGL